MTAKPKGENLTLFGGRDAPRAPKTSASSRTLSLFDTKALAPVHVSEADKRLAHLPLPLFERPAPPPAEVRAPAPRVSRRKKRLADKPKSPAWKGPKPSRTEVRAALARCQARLRTCDCGGKKKT